MGANKAMRVEITYENRSRSSTSYSNVEAVSYGGGEQALITTGGSEIEENGVKFVHVYEE